MVYGYNTFQTISYKDKKKKLVHLLWANVWFNYLTMSSYPSDLSGPRHHDGVGDGGGQSDQWGNVDGPAGPLRLHAVFGWREITLDVREGKKKKEIRKFAFLLQIFKFKWIQQQHGGTRQRMEGTAVEQSRLAPIVYRQVARLPVDFHTQIGREMVFLRTAGLRQAKPQLDLHWKITFGPRDVPLKDRKQTCHHMAVETVHVLIAGSRASYIELLICWTCCGVNAKAKHVSWNRWLLSEAAEEGGRGRRHFFNNQESKHARTEF